MNKHPHRSCRRVAASSGIALAGLLVAAGTPQASRAQALVGDPARGQRLFLQCQACHALEPAASTIGPPLLGVVGRKAASAPGYSYSPALTASGLVWNDATLDKWLEHPNALVPGTKMIFTGVANPGDRLSIVAFLKQSSAISAKH